MNCSYMITPQFANIERLNNKVLSQIMQFPDKIRKEIRLLAKQYELLELLKKEDEYLDAETFGNLMLRQNPFILKYKNIQSDEVFEWEIGTELFNN